MKPDIEELRKKYIENPPEGMTSEDIRHMSEDDLLDMDYFLNEDDPFDDLFGERVFLLLSGKIGISYKGKRVHSCIPGARKTAIRLQTPSLL